MKPRGIRNNNPGNIRVGDPWQGLAERDQMTEAQKAETEFCVFADPTWGIRAIARLLVNYQDRYGLNTVRGIIDRWAPPVENDTRAYQASVAGQIGVGVSDQINVHQYVTMAPLVRAIILHENGRQPYTSGQIDEGLRLAGVKPRLKPIAESKTLGGAVPSVVGGATAAGGVISALGSLSPLAQAIIGGGLVLAMAGAAFVIWNRWQERKRGER